MPTARELATTQWNFSGEQRDAITAGASCVSAQTLLKIETLLTKQNQLIEAQTRVLDAIRGDLLSLGVDGLHHVIRYHRRQVRAANAKARRPRQPQAASTP